MNLVDSVLRVARAEVGVREQGANWGDRVREYLAAVEIHFPASWCAAFVRWCLQRAAADAGAVELVTRTLAGIRPRDFAYCPFIDAWARREGILEASPRPGDLFLYYHGGRARHVGFVASVTGPMFKTLEGNTNDNGSPDGIGVFSRIRWNGSAYRFVRWADLLPELENAAPARRRLVLAGKAIAECPVLGGQTLAPVRTWGEALGFTVGWSAANGAVTFNGESIDAETTLLEGSLYAPVRDLARGAGLRVLSWDAEAVHVGR